MATYKIIPLEMISAPNYFSALPNNRWTVTGGNPATLWFQLQISDNLGDRRYIPAVGATLEVTFQRSDSVSMGFNTSYPTQLSTTPQSIIKPATFNASDRSLGSFVLTPVDASNIVSGSLLFKFTESGVVNQWVQNWSIYKKLVTPGS
jgi:hypothetical protein